MPFDADTQRLIDYADNALLKEMDRATGVTMGGLPLLPTGPGVLSSEDLDRDHYARALAAELGSSEARVQSALASMTAAPPVQVMAEDIVRYAEWTGVDATDRTAVVEAWRTASLDVATNLCNRALHLINTTKGPVPDPGLF